MISDHHRTLYYFFHESICLHICQKVFEEPALRVDKKYVQIALYLYSKSWSVNIKIKDTNDFLNTWNNSPLRRHLFSIYFSSIIYFNWIKKYGLTVRYCNNNFSLLSVCIITHLKYVRFTVMRFLCISPLGIFSFLLACLLLHISAYNINICEVFYFSN